MPTVFELYGYRFFFYSNENNEPVHIHVSKGDAEAKYWVGELVVEEYAYGFKIKERKLIKEIVRNSANEIINSWNEFFK